MIISQRTQHVYAAFAGKLVKINLWRGSLTELMDTENN